LASRSVTYEPDGVLVENFAEEDWDRVRNENV
jgi:hypothetical protein